MVLFALVKLYSSNMHSKCYRLGDPVTGQRNYSYKDVFKANLRSYCWHFHVNQILILFLFRGLGCRRVKGVILD